MAETEQIINDILDSKNSLLVDTWLAFAPENEDQEKVMIRFALCIDRFVQGKDGRITEAEHLSKMRPSNDGMKYLFNENFLENKNIYTKIYGHLLIKATNPKL